jgi:hypothetical protein
MKSGNDVDLTPSQARSLETLRHEIARDLPRAEIKSWTLTQPDDHEAPDLAKIVIVEAEVGFRGDDASDYRKALRERLVYTVSPRGRVEQWSVRAFKHTSPEPKE